jgi:thioesterase domain-containing protein
VPGDHLGMLTEPHVAALADAVRAALAPAPFSVPT